MLCDALARRQGAVVRARHVHHIGHCREGAAQTRLIFTDFSPIFRTFLGDFSPDRLDPRSLQTLWEWKNRVLLEEYYIFNVVIPLEAE